MSIGDFPPYYYRWPGYEPPTFFSWSSTFDADALLGRMERLEKKLDALINRDVNECEICGKRGVFGTKMPYETDLDGEWVCSECLQRGIDFLRNRKGEET